MEAMTQYETEKLSQALTSHSQNSRAVSTRSEGVIENDARQGCEIKKDKREGEEEEERGEGGRIEWKGRKRNAKESGTTESGIARALI